MLSIHNPLTLDTQRLLNRNQVALESNQARLASGLRINSAADDAAGSAMVTQFAAQIAGNAQGVRNLSDGFSMLQTAESGVGQISDAMERLRELSLQSLNGTVSESDRATLQQEAGAMLEQVAQIFEDTQFNGNPLLTQDSALQLQAGAGPDDRLTVNLGNVQGALGKLGFEGIDLSTPAGATDALKILDQSSEVLGEVQGTLGAAQNRFQSSISALLESNVNSARAQSGIRDTDYAREIAERSQNLIRTQANIAMLTQGNTISSQLVAQLLGE